MERRRKEAEVRRKETERRFKAYDCHTKWLNEKSQQIKQKKNNERRKKEEQQMEGKMVSMLNIDVLIFNRIRP